MKTPYVKIATSILLFVTQNASYCTDEAILPATVEELVSFLENVGSKPLPDSLRDRRFPLPRTFSFDGNKIDSYYLKGSHLYLADSKSSALGFLFVKQAPSIDRMLAAKTLGSLASMVSSTEMPSWEAIQDGGMLLDGEVPTDSAMLVPLRIAFTRGATICFMKAIFPLKMTSSPVSRENKEIGDAGPVSFSIYSTDLFFEGN